MLTPDKVLLQMLNDRWLSLLLNVHALAGTMSGLCPSRNSNPYCSCRYLRKETAPPLESQSLGPTWWQDMPIELRTQSCCDMLLGKTNRAAVAATEGGGGADIPWHDHYLYFNSRRNCARGARLLEHDGGTCPGKTCCRRTQLQVARWDHEVRGRCWVLRPR